MGTVILHFNNGTTWKYQLVKDNTNYIYMQDSLDGTAMRYNKETKELYSYDVYNSTWKLMKNTSSMIKQLEIQE